MTFFDERELKISCYSKMQKNFINLFLSMMRR